MNFLSEGGLELEFPFRGWSGTCRFELVILEETVNSVGFCAVEMYPYLRDHFFLDRYYTFFLSFFFFFGKGE